MYFGTVEDLATQASICLELGMGCPLEKERMSTHRWDVGQDSRVTNMLLHMAPLSMFTPGSL